MASAATRLKSQEKPIVFVVDDDISVRESLESLLSFAGWQPETFASAEEFLARPPSHWVFQSRSELGFDTLRKALSPLGLR